MKRAGLVRAAAVAVALATAGGLAGRPIGRNEMYAAIGRQATRVVETQNKVNAAALANPQLAKAGRELNEHLASRGIEFRDGEIVIQPGEMRMTNLNPEFLRRLDEISGRIERLAIRDSQFQTARVEHLRAQVKLKATERADPRIFERAGAVGVGALLPLEVGIAALVRRKWRAWKEKRERRKADD